MAFWSKDGKDKEKDAQDPQALVARREYDKAIKAYRAQIAAQPTNHMLNHKVADVLCLAGRPKDSLADYSLAADGYAREGFLIKAVAILKKMQKLDPGNASVEKRLATLGKLGSSTSPLAPSAPSALSAADIGAGEGPELAFDMEAIDDAPSIPVSGMDEAPPRTAARLAMTPLFSDFTPDELAGVLGSLRHHAFPAGSILVREGEAGASLFVISEGKVKVTTQGPKGSSLQLAELKEGDFFGEVALLTGKPRTATITSMEETEVLELTRDGLGALESRHPRVRQVVKEFYDRRVASTIEAMIQAVRSPKTRPKG
jgi:cAMP-dependent protein kinase regulator